MASCVRNIRTKNHQNLLISFQVTVKMSGMFFWDTVYVSEKNFPRKCSIFK